MIVLYATLDRNGWADRLGGWMLLVGIGPIAGAVLAALFVTTRLNRARVGGLARPLELAGFSMTPQPTTEEKAAFGAPLEAVMVALAFRYGSAGIQWFAVETRGSPPACLFEHEFVTGSGKSTQVHTHTVLVWPAQHPHLRMRDLATRRAFGLGRFSWLVRRTYQDRELKDQAFAALRARWVAFGSADTGKAFLLPPVPEHLKRAPAGEQWYVGEGVIACCFRGVLDGENISRFVQHARAVTLIDTADTAAGATTAGA